MVYKILLLVVFFAVMIAVGIICRKKSTDVNGFVLGGRSIGPWLTAFAYGTSYFSAVIFIGYAGQFGWKFGIASTWIGIGNAILGSLLVWLVMGKRTRLMSQHFNSKTMSDFFGKRFDSKGLKTFAAIIIFVFLIPYTASLYNGLSRLFEMAFNIDYFVCIIIMTVLTCVYVIVGGYVATAINDFIQGIIMLFGIVAVVVAVLVTNGGLSEAFSNLSLISSEAEGIKAGSFTSILGPDPFSLICVIILTSLGTWGMPQMVQKFYAIKDEKSIKKGMIISTIFALVVAGGCYFLGGFGRLYTGKVDVSKGFDNIVPTMLQGLPDILIGVVVVLVLSASMSTLSSLVMSSSSTLTLDLIKDNCKKEMSEKKQVLIMRILIAVFIALSAGIALLQYYSKGSGFIKFIAQLMGVSWGALAGAFLGPYIYGLYWKRTTKAACYTSFVLGVSLMILCICLGNVLPPVLKSPINVGAIAMLLSLIVVPVVSLFTKKPDEKVIENAFSCLNKTTEMLNLEEEQKAETETTDK